MLLFELQVSDMGLEKPEDKIRSLSACNTQHSIFPRFHYAINFLTTNTSLPK
ncbi:hypothetical protein D1AOALGA4SA_8158 [Olavius algarvensis Delta 1 endosymbiont]|nr:hypothetical protein D1AOALGA4SA_8158 [Olavius algarvensis Delta 1 endosymbiont]